VGGHISSVATVTKPAPTGGVAAELASLLEQGHPLILYDGVCALCNGFVNFVLPRDSEGKVRFATLQGKWGRAVVQRNAELAAVDSIILVTPSGAYVRSTAVLEIARYLGGLWTLLLVGYALPRALRDWIYDAVARRRYQTFGKYDACPIPPVDVRHRFLAD